MAYVNHNNTNVELSVADMVRVRLPFIAENDDNDRKLSIFTLEVMNELENCFKVRIKEDGTEDITRVGNEEYYTTLQKSIIADIVAVYIILLLGAGATFDGSGTVVTSQALNKFLSKAKAGSVESEWQQFDLKKDTASTLIGSTGLIDLYKNAAIRKARQLGCIIDICGDCSLSVELLNSKIPLPFINLGFGCC